MSMLSLRRSQKQSGFTLMELLIVIAVLGLLLGMLIPRLAGITDDTVDTVCDTNNKGTRYLTQMYINKYNAWPNNLTNLVNAAGSDEESYTAVAASFGEYTVTPSEYSLSLQNDAQTEAQILAAEFWTRNVPGVYFLSLDEVNELRDMGITSLYNEIGTDGRSMQREAVSTEIPVMVMGMNAAEAGEDDDDAPEPTFTFDDDYPVGNPEWIGRIMFAVNDKCDLVKKGILQASALCPGAVLAEEDFEHKEYILVLPRLEATMDRFGQVVTSEEGATDTTYGDNPYAGKEFLFVDATDADGRVMDFIFEAQSSWEFDMSCPEGHKWPDNDEDSWVLLKSTDGEYTVEVSSFEADGDVTYTYGTTGE